MLDQTAKPADALFGRVLGLLAGAEAAAAIGAQLAAELEGGALPAAVVGCLERVSALAAPELASSSLEQKRAVLGAIRAQLRQASDLLGMPGKEPGWSYTDPAVLNEQGHASGAFGPLLAGLLERMGPAPEGPRRFLDVGTGAGWLAIALARALPGAEVVGIDVWPPALTCARHNVAVEGLGERVRLLEQNLVELEGEGRFDAAWLAGPFLPRAVVAPGLARVRRALRPGGVVFFGMFAGGEAPLAQALSELRTVRSGGHPFSSAELVALMGAAGLVDAHEVPRSWAAPLRLIAGKAPEHAP